MSTQAGDWYDGRLARRGRRVKPDPAVMAELKKINDQITSHAAELLADPSKAESLLK